MNNGYNVVDFVWLGYRMLRKQGKYQNLALAAALLAGLSAVVFLFLKGGQALTAAGFPLEIVFPAVRGLEVGARVRVLGVQAGEVTKIELEKGQVVVLTRLENRFREVLKADARPRIVSEGLVGGQTVEIHPGIASENLEIPTRLQGAPLPDWEKGLEQLAELGPKLCKKAEESLKSLDELTLAARKTLDGVNSGRGSLGKLATDTTLYEQMVRLTQQGQEALRAITRDAEAMQSVPGFSGLVRDPERALIRPDCKAKSWFFPESELFEPGTALLTELGLKKLDAAGKECAKETKTGSEIVIASYSSPGEGSGIPTRVLTDRQAESVAEHLKANFSVQKTGWLSWRRVTALGMGDQPPPAGKKPLGPAPRLEIWLFVPAK